MNKLLQIHRDDLLLRDGGSCRDITFAALSLQSTVRAVKWFQENYNLGRNNALFEEEPGAIEPLDFFKKNYQYLTTSPPDHIATSPHDLSA